jgi:hypothetical protein
VPCTTVGVNWGIEPHVCPQVRLIDRFAVVLAGLSVSGVFSIERLTPDAAVLIGELPVQIGERIKLLLHLEGHPTVIGATITALASHDEVRNEIVVAFEATTSEVRERIARCAETWDG